MQFDHDVIIEAPLPTVWRVYSDIERWPDWTASIRTVRYLDGGEIELGTHVKIEQPKLPKAEWEITSVEPGRAWTWVAKAPGIRTTATHRLIEHGDGATQVRTTIAQDGPLGAVLGRIYARLTRSYLAMEAAGLKARSEAAAAA